MNIFAALSQEQSDEDDAGKEEEDERPGKKSSKVSTDAWVDPRDERNVVLDPEVSGIMVY